MTYFLIKIRAFKSYLNKALYILPLAYLNCQITAVVLWGH
jgi:hypothetical protein